MKKKSLPIYQQIKTFIISKIASGELQPDMQIPSEAELGRLFSTSRMTVNRALRELAGEGLIFRRQGAGSFVARQKHSSPLLEVRSISEEIRLRGGTHSCQMHFLGEEKASPEIALSLEMAPYSSVFHLIIAHLADGVPVLLADRYVNPVFAPHFLDQNFQQINPSSYLLGIATPTKVEHVVEALIPENWIRERLQINEAEPCLSLKRRTWVNHLVATRSSFYYPGSRYRLASTFSPAANGTLQLH